jgi:hypothetical protein
MHYRNLSTVVSLEKVLLDPKTSQPAFNKAMVTMITDMTNCFDRNKFDKEHFFKALDVAVRVFNYHKENAKKRDTCLRLMMNWASNREAGEEILKRVSDPMVRYCVDLVKNDREIKMWGVRLIDFLGLLGPRAADAVQSLEIIRDRDDDALARAAFRALKKIQAE